MLKNSAWIWMFRDKINAAELVRAKSPSLARCKRDKFKIDWYVLHLRAWMTALYRETYMKEAFIVAADCVRQGLYTEVLYKVKTVGRARNWPLWADDLYTEVNIKAGLIVLLFLWSHFQDTVCIRYSMIKDSSLSPEFLVLLLWMASYSRRTNFCVFCLSRNSSTCGIEVYYLNMYIHKLVNSIKF